MLLKDVSKTCKATCLYLHLLSRSGALAPLGPAHTYIGTHSRTPVPHVRREAKSSRDKSQKHTYLYISRARAHGDLVGRRSAVYRVQLVRARAREKSRGTFFIHIRLSLSRPMTLFFVLAAASLRARAGKSAISAIPRAV